MKQKLQMIILLSYMAFGIILGCILSKSVISESEVIIDKGIIIEEVIDEPEASDEVENNLIYLGEFLLTGYCDCEICQEEWVGTTALGIPPESEWTIAVDPNIIPLGSYVWINGHRYYAADVGGMINENHIDIFCSSHEECYSDFCNGYAEVYIEG